MKLAACTAPDLQIEKMVGPAHHSGIMRALPVLREAGIAQARALRCLDVGKTDAAATQRSPVDLTLVVGYVHALNRIPPSRQLEILVKPGRDKDKRRNREGNQQKQSQIPRLPSGSRL